MHPSLRRAVGATILTTALLPGLPAAGAPAAPGDRAASPTPTLQPRPLPVDDLTDLHPELVDELVARAATQGITLDPDELRVVRPRTGSTDLHVLGPRAHLVAVDGGQVEVAIDPPAIAPAAARTVRSGASWKLAGSDCFGRWRYDGTYIDACWRESVLMGDPDSSRTWFALEYWATAGPEDHLLAAAELSAASLDPGASWADWSPRSDSSGSCQSTSVSVSVLGLGVGETYDRCETWDVTKRSTAQGGLVNRYRWGGGLLPGSPHDREVALTMAIAIPQSDAHQGWYLTRGLDGAS